MKPFWTEATFWENVDKSGDCWTWKGRTDRGYGKLHFRGKADRSHRVAYILSAGLAGLATEQVVCHRCDNPPCCNPCHLFLGTHAVNNADMDSKGRRKMPRCRGEAHGHAKMSNDTAMAVRYAVLLSGCSQRVAAAHVGVHQMSISNLMRGESYR